ncbi:MAG TPA: GT4 family glycosyltransferase PelF, partial [Polyangia bacterium]|nr:GT4 family glycosyltransferase PelF [Polyangia bacterium]
LVEGTYPFVSGGVSSWVHDIILGHPALRFAVLNVGSHPGAYGEPRFQLPANVVGLHRVFCQETARPPLDGAARADLREQIRELRTTVDTRAQPSRVLAGLRRMHLDGEGDAESQQGILDDLATNDLALDELLYGRASFDLLTQLSDRVAAEAPFLDLFWHFRAIHVPMLRLLSAPVVPAACYHAIATGYAGLLAAVWSRRTQRPLALTEHGIYAREREMELARADWIRDAAETDDGGFGLRTATWAPHVSPLRKIWSGFFRALSRLAYAQAGRIVTLSEVNRVKQIADGAPAAKIEIVPNGVDLPDDAPPLSAVNDNDAPDDDLIELRPAPLRVGFVGRVVPIKDLITFIRACDLALHSVELEVRVIGPMEEDAAYATRCRDLVARLGRDAQIAFVGPMPPAQIYGDLDVVVLTSFSEGQPLVILEAYARGVPVIASDVGACREMIEGRAAADREIGPSGFVTRVATPKETAAALVRLARDPKLRRRMGQAGLRRVAAYYQRRDMLASYRALYAAMGAGDAATEVRDSEAPSLEGSGAEQQQTGAGTP